MTKPHWLWLGHWGFSLGPCTGPRELREPLEMVTISALDLLLPANQGKHLPRSQLQDTISPGPGFPISTSRDRSNGSGSPVKLPTVF